MTNKYRNKVEIKAEQFNNSESSLLRINHLLSETGYELSSVYFKKNLIEITTPRDEVFQVLSGNWVIKNIVTEQVCSLNAEIFERIYEKIKNGQ